MYYKNTTVLNFGKYAGVRVKWIRTINGRTVYAYDVGKLTTCAPSLTHT